MSHTLAKNAAKKAFENLCIFRLTEGVDGAHLLTAGRWPELADEPLNILPISRDIHSGLRPCFDYRADGSERPASERLWIARELCHVDVRRLVKLRTQRLMLTCYAQGVDIPEPLKPADLTDLIVAAQRVAF